MNIPRLIKVAIIACLLTVGGCATTGAPGSAANDLPPMREDTIDRLAGDGQNAYINGVRAPHGSYVRDGEVVTTGPGTSANLILNSGASIQLDQNTDPLFKLIRQGACVLMEIIRGQAAVATNDACVEFRNDRLDTAGVAHSVINIHAAEREVRVTVIEGQVQMLRPGDAMVGANQEYVSTEGGRWQVRQITPAEAAGTGVWTRDYFRAAARQNQSNYLIPAIIAIGLGTYFNNKDGHSSQPSSTQYPPAGPNSPRSQ
jgi:hypothetical protein